MPALKTLPRGYTLPNTQQDWHGIPVSVLPTCDRWWLDENGQRVQCPERAVAGLVDDPDQWVKFTLYACQEHAPGLQALCEEKP